MFWGDLIVSKAATAGIRMWKPRSDRKVSVRQLPPSRLRASVLHGPLCCAVLRCAALRCAALLCTAQSVLLLQDFEFDQCDIWFIQFAFNNDRTLLAVGNRAGSIFIWQGAVPSFASLPAVGY